MMEEVIVFIDSNPLVAGIIFIVLGLLLLLHKLKSKPVKFGDSTLLGWKAHVSLLAVIAMCFIYGLVLIFKAI